MKDNLILTISLESDESSMEQTKNRRTHERLLCSELLEVIWRDDAGRERRRIGNLEDISPAGICLQMEVAIPIGTAVTMLCGPGALSGVVRYCRSGDVGHSLGIEFDPGHEWSSERFRPKHLLDLRELAAQTRT